MADDYVLPDPKVIAASRSTIITELPTKGLGIEAVKKHLQKDIVPGLNRSSESPRYYGFVTGGSTPAALLADNIVTQQDQNVAVHLPNDSIATNVEDAALRMMAELVELEPAEWPHRIFTTGATASNVLGLACGREHVVRVAAERAGKSDVSVGELGLVEALREADLSDGIQVLTTMPHSSLLKAASILGLGRASIKHVGKRDMPLRIDMSQLKLALMKRNVGSIVVVSCAEVNTGHFATNGFEMQQLRELCDKHGAWLHVDAAFGLMARMLPKREEYEELRAGVENFELADSITGDAHKMLNVPYDCGIFFSKDLSTATAVFQNVNAAYLNVSSSGIPSPLNIGLENSRRFRALPVYATLAAYGCEWYTSLIEQQIKLARYIAEYIGKNEYFQLLPYHDMGLLFDQRPMLRKQLRETYVIVLFRAHDPRINRELVSRINSQRKIYVSGTTWDGLPAARFAVANWQVDVMRDFLIVRDVLEEALCMEGEFESAPYPPSPPPSKPRSAVNEVDVTTPPRRSSLADDFNDLS